MEFKTQVICDGVRVDKNVIPAHLTQLLEGNSNFIVEYVYYSGSGKNCQSGNCNKHITNIYVIKDKSTNEEFHVGCECVKKYGESIGQLVSYWQKKLESAKRAVIWQAKRASWVTERDEKKRVSIEAHTKELEFIHRYSGYMSSPFLESIQNVIENGWNMSDKQRLILNKIMGETDFVKLEEQAKCGEERFQEVLELIQIIDHVKMGMYPGATQYDSIRNQFEMRGVLTDKQIGFLHKLVNRFRKQLDKI